MDESKNRLDKLTEFYRSHRRLPGYKEMMTLFGFRSKNSVYKFITRLVEEGLLTKDSAGHISPTGGWLSGLKLLGSVQAGLPSVVEEDWSETISLDEYFTLGQKAGPQYILTVTGDSMIDAGIREGDMVIVEKKTVAKVGDIVVACVDGDWTLKYLREDKRGRRYLEPANRRYQNIYPESALSVGGVVKGVLRKY